MANFPCQIARLRLSGVPPFPASGALPFRVAQTALPGVQLSIHGWMIPSWAPRTAFRSFNHRVLHTRLVHSTTSSDIAVPRLTRNAHCEKTILQSSAIIPRRFNTSQSATRVCENGLVFPRGGYSTLRRAYSGSNSTPHPWQRDTANFHAQLTDFHTRLAKAEPNFFLSLTLEELHAFNISTNSPWLAAAGYSSAFEVLLTLSGQDKPCTMFFSEVESKPLFDRFVRTVLKPLSTTTAASNDMASSFAVSHARNSRKRIQTGRAREFWRIRALNTGARSKRFS